MSWSISVLENTLVLTDSQRKGLAKLLESIGHVEDFEEGRSMLNEYAPKISFSLDAYEHMDYMWDDKVQKYLTAQKVTGEVVFGSTEGDNKGAWWSYEYKNGVLNQDSGSLKDFFKRKTTTSNTAVTTNKFLSGKSIAITGKLNSGTRAFWKTRLSALGAIVVSDVNPDTNLLLTNEDITNNSRSAKAMDAKRHNIPVMNENAMENMMRMFA